MKYLVKLSTLAFLLFSLPALAIDNLYCGSRAKALSNAVVAVPDIWSSFHNQAGLAWADQFSAGVYFESRFLIDELSLMAGTISIPSKSGVFALSYSQFGSGLYKESKVGLAMAKRLSPKIAAGIQLDYQSMLFPENSRAKGFFTFEAGAMYSPSGKFIIGAHVFNPVQAGIKALNETIKSPLVMRFGGCYFISEEVFVCSEVESVYDRNHILKFGLEYKLLDNLDLKFGLSSQPFSYSSGIGYKIKNIQTDISFNYTGNLGVTPSISIQFLLK